MPEQENPPGVVPPEPPSPPVNPPEIAAELTDGLHANPVEPNNAQADLQRALDVKTESRSEQQQITARASVVAMGTLTSRMLGLVRDQVLAARFDIHSTDAFFVAFLIPNVLRQLLAEGAVQTGVLPVLTQVREQQGETAARQAFRALRGVSLTLLLLVSVLGVLFAEPLTVVFAGGYASNPALFERTVKLTRWVFPYIFFMGSAALGIAVLNMQRRFVVTAYAPALLNVAFICAALLGVPFCIARGFDPLAAIAVGVLVGGVLQVLAQWPSLRAIGYLETPRLNLRDPVIGAVFRRMTPVLFGFGVYYVDVAVARHLLSDLGPGPQSYFAFAQRICDFPQGIFVMAVQSATLPTLAALSANKKWETLRDTFLGSARLALFVAVPATGAVVVLAEPLVSWVFERGHFDAHAAQETAAALRAQGAGIWTVALVRQLVIVFYALGDTRSPVWISALDFVVFLLAALGLRASFGHVGISWAVTLSGFAQVALLWFQLKRRLKAELSLRRALAGQYKLWLATLAAMAASIGVLHLETDSIGIRGKGLVAGVLYIGVFFAVAGSLQSQELLDVWRPIARRLGLLRRRAD